MSINLTTTHVRCEPLTAAHADVMFPVLLDERIYTFTPGKAPESLEALRKRYELLSLRRSPAGTEQWLNWILFERQTERPMGFAQATIRPDSCSIAYVLNPLFWNRGYASEALSAVMIYLFKTFDMPSLRAEIHPENVASRRLLHRLGFSFTHHDGEEGDDVFGITRAEWLARCPL